MSTTVILTAIVDAAQGVRLLRLSPLPGETLVAFQAGAHLDLYLPNGLVRSYSLINTVLGNHAEHYELAIGLSASSAGGSRYVHDALELGQTLTVGLPRNHFPLVDSSTPVVFIAGGIGVTPIRAMIYACISRGRPWQLIYAARSRANAVFADELASISENVRFHFDDEQNQKLLDLEALLADIPATSHIYCCGPPTLMTRVRDSCLARPQDHVHFEWFNAPAVDASQISTAFVIELSRQGKRLDVPANRSILDVLEDNGVIVPSVCKEGVCGTCECDVIEGDVDHRDQVLTQDERAAGKTMMVCVSRARSSTLVLDL